MKTRIQSLSFLATLAVVLGLISWGSALHAQTTPSSSDQQTQPTPTPDTPPSQQTQQPSQTPSPEAPPASQQTPSAQTPDQSPTPNSQSPNSQTPNTQSPDTRTPNSQTPDSRSSGSSASTPNATDSQTFSGTVMKSGDKYVLKTDTGKTYDIDHQDDVKKFDGKRVRVQGTLDESGTKIQVK
ncbi:MAG: hypothetical protein DMG79_00735 [Acidobacteria bacterium]|nr:MAG: hypothetical protein DMG79_00735 [Acidobacteriota bacterium]